MAKRAYKVTSTTILTAVPDCDVFTYTNHCSVVNKTDGDLEVYFGQTDNPDIICPQGVMLAFDSFSLQGQVYIRNLTGSGGQVYLHFWKKENY